MNVMIHGTAWKVSVFGVILVRLFPLSDWIRIFPYLIQMRENTDQNNSEYGHFLRSVKYTYFSQFSRRIIG